MPAPLDPAVQTAALEPVGPALAMLDVVDIPHGLAALDALAKEAEVRVVAAGTVQAGEYLLLFGGEVEPTERSFLRAVERAGGALRDRVLLPWAEERILPALRDGARRWPCPGDTLGVIQTAAPPTLLRCVDAALKGAEVDLVELRVGDGLGGRAVASLWGELYDVQAALELAELAAGRGLAEGYSALAIPRADPEVGRALAPSSRFFKEWRG